MRQTDKEYAEALFMLSEEEGQTKEYREALLTVKESIEENPEYIDFLRSPAIALSERLSAIDEAFGDFLPENILSFIKLLCENGHIQELLSSINEFNKLVDALLGKALLNVYSAVELTNEQKLALCQKLNKVTEKTVDPVFTVDPSIIGGIKIELDGKTYDGSIKTRLRDIKDVIL